MALPEILLIEDRKDDRDLFDAAARASGLRATITFAHDAAEAVMRLNRLGAYASTELPSLIVLDLGLPGLQGRTLLEVIRNAYGPRAITVVVLTGNHGSREQAQCESLGISEFMIKPQEYAELVEWVRSLGRFLPADDGSGDARASVSPPEKTVDQAKESD